MSSSSNFLIPAMKRLMKPTQKLKPGLLPKNIIPKNKWTILRGDKVHVVNGHHTGEVGIVQAVIRKQNRIIVEGVNMRKYSKKPEGGGRGTTVTREAAIHVTNVNLVCPETGFPTKVSYKFLEDGTRVRVAKRSGAVIPRPEILSVRRKPRSNLTGPKDTVKEDVEEVTFRGLDENGYENPPLAA
ncbi:unnamed protein product [Ectocarpus sp. 12 AP-2014]